jgi:hypothetical protein
MPVANGQQRAIRGPLLVGGVMRSRVAGVREKKAIGTYMPANLELVFGGVVAKLALNKELANNVYLPFRLEVR